MTPFNETDAQGVANNTKMLIEKEYKSKRHLHSKQSPANDTLHPWKVDVDRQRSANGSHGRARNRSRLHCCQAKWKRKAGGDLSGS